MIDRCPFCGSAQPEPPVVETEYGATVTCVRCSAQGPVVIGKDNDTPEDTTSKAIELWNRRSLGRAEI